MRQLPDDIVFELEEFPLLFVVLEEYLTLSQLSWQIVRVHINLNLELLGHCILHVLVQLTIAVEECMLVGALRLLGHGCAQVSGIHFWDLLLLTCTHGYLFHEHKDLIYPSDVFLHFSDVVEKNSGFDSLCTL